MTTYTFYRALDAANPSIVPVGVERFTKGFVWINGKAVKREPIAGRLTYHRTFAAAQNYLLRLARKRVYLAEKVLANARQWQNRVAFIKEKTDDHLAPDRSDPPQMGVAPVPDATRAATGGLHLHAGAVAVAAGGA